MLLHIILSLAMLAILLPGCAVKKTHAPARSQPPPSSHQKPAARPAADPKAQQRYYDLGLQNYSKENYDEARDAFEQVVEINPNSSLGLKAQENIRKIDQILKTLKEIEKK
jgi:TolA-binding protein